MNLDTSEWKEFYLGELFDIKKGKRLTAEDQEEGTNNYIGAIDTNNGVANHIGQKPIHSGNTISLSYNGSVGEAFYQPEPYWATDDVNALYPRYKNFNVYHGMFIATVIKKEKYKYSYGRKWTLENMKKSIIKLPIKGDGTPDWQFMEDYVKTLHYKKLSTTNTTQSAIKLNIELWESFQLKDIFNVINGKGLTTEEIENYPGDINCIQGGEENNGSIGQINKEYCRKNGYTIIENMCLTVARVGTAGCVNFWEAPCAIGDKCKGLILKTSAKKEIYLFLATLLRKLSDKYNYGRGLVTEKYMNEYIKLPVMPDGTPDWQFMEDYIKSLPYGDRI